MNERSEISEAGILPGDIGREASTSSLEVLDYILNNTIDIDIMLEYVVNGISWTSNDGGYYIISELIRMGARITPNDVDDPVNLTLISLM